MDLSIQKILRKNKVKGVFHTHVSMGETRGKYQFNRQDLEEFWKTDFLFRGNKEKISFRNKLDFYK